MKDVALGIKLLQKATEKFCPTLLAVNRQAWYRVCVLLLTYVAFGAYHISRKPFSVVKTIWHQDCTLLVPPLGITPNNTSWCSWAPFDTSQDEASEMFGELDSAFLFAYAFGIFGAGIIVDHFNIRYFLTIGMVLSGLFSCMLGLAKTINIHSYAYFAVVQVAAGVSQASGWPGFMAILGNWCGKHRRGLILGIWNTQNSVGHILGSLIAAAFLETNWALSFIWPGLIMIFMAFLLFFFLVIKPSDVGLAKREDDHEQKQDLKSERPEEQTETTHLLKELEAQTEERAIGFLGALRIPGVLEYALSLFFLRIVQSTFVYWLPLYLNKTTNLSAKNSADLSTMYDVGGIIGGIVAGGISDCVDMPATTCSGMLLLAIPTLLLYQRFGSLNLWLNILMLVIIGILAVGPPSLIATAVSTNLSTHSTLEKNLKAFGTVAAIIDGTGCIGAAVGPLIAGFITKYGWNTVFYMMIASDVLSMLHLIRVVTQEITAKRRNS